MISLPSNPSLNQEVTVNNTTYRFDGIAWTTVAQGSIEWDDIGGLISGNSALSTELNARVTSVTMNGGNLTPLVDANESATGEYNISINGNLLDNISQIEVGITYSVSQVTINATNYAPGTIPVADVGTFNFASGGNWSFTPTSNYVGAVPVVTYTVVSSDGKSNTSTLTISAITELIDGGGASTTGFAVTIDGGGSGTSSFESTIDGGAA